MSAKTKAFIKAVEKVAIAAVDGHWNADKAIAESRLLDELTEYIESANRTEMLDKMFSRQIWNEFSDSCESEMKTTDLDNEINKILSEMDVQWAKLNVTTTKPTAAKRNSSGGGGSMANRVMRTLSDDGSEIATRLAARQLTKTIAEPITAMLASGLGMTDDSGRGKIARFLETDIGAGFVSFALSIGVSSLPLPDSAKQLVERVTRELRLQGEVAIASPIVEAVAAPLRMLLTEKVMALPMLASAIGANKQLVDSTEK